MFKNPIAPPKSPVKVPKPLEGQPSYDNKKKMFPAGDYYGTGFRAKVGKLRGDTDGVSPVPMKSMRKDPKTLA